jgi:Helix-turn-helix domain
MGYIFRVSAAAISLEYTNIFAIYTGLPYSKPMRKTYKYRIYLTSGQKGILKIQLEECRWVWNQLLEAREYAHQYSVKCTRYDLINLLPTFKLSTLSV